MSQEGVTETDPSNMSIKERMSSLQEKHASLKVDLIDDNRRPMPNVVAIKPMKRKNLNIKDEMKIIKS